MPNNSTTDEVSNLGYVVWAETSEGGRYKIERTERDETSGNKIKIYLRPCGATGTNNMRFQLFWQPTEHQMHHYLCTTIVSPPQHGQGKRYCFMSRNTNAVYSTGYASSKSGWRQRDAFRATIPSHGSYVATVTLKIKRVMNDISSETIKKLESINKSAFASLPDFSEDNVLADEEPTVFQFDFHSYESVKGRTIKVFRGKEKSTAPTLTAKRKQDESEDSDCDNNGPPFPKIPMRAPALAPDNFKRSRVFDSDIRPRPSGSSSQGTTHLKRRLTSLPPTISAPASFEKNIQKLQEIMEERQALRKELEKRVKEEDATNDMLRQALAKYSN